MGVSIGWAPKNPENLNYISATSSLHGTLENLFGGFPMVLDCSHIGKLEGVAACGYEGADDLISAINEWDMIVVKAEW